MKHGYTAYSNHGCRCVVCTEDNRRKCREYYARNRERLGEYARQYRIRNAASVAETQRAIYESDLEGERARGREYYAAKKSLVSARKHAQNERTRTSTSRSGQRWSAAEDEICSDRSISAIEVASLLNRTLLSVNARRHQLRKRFRPLV